MSVEQSPHFHIVRRLLRSIDPEYRVLTTASLKPFQCCLDHKKKSLEIGDDTPVMKGVAMLLFQLGHLNLKNDPTYTLFFGEGFHEWTDSEENLISLLVNLGSQADQAASTWAIEILKLYYYLDEEEAIALVAPLIWTKEEWHEYFS